jgi:hypothetical protein
MREGALHELKMVERALLRRPPSSEQLRRLRPILDRLRLRRVLGRPAPKHSGDEIV